MPEPIGKLSSIMLHVIDMDDACEFYENVMGFELKRRDGERWAEFDAGTIVIALASRDQVPVSNSQENTSLNVKVSDVKIATERSLWGGARLVEDVRVSAHEKRATVKDPSGRIINFYSSI